MDEVVAVLRVERVLIARCEGDLDLGTEPVLRKGLTGLLGPAGPPSCDAVILDLSAVTFLDCTAIAVVLDLARACARGDVDLVLSGATPIMQQVLDVLALDDVLTIVRGVTEALDLTTAWSQGSGRAARRQQVLRQLLPGPHLPLPSPSRD
jgi:anti-anti-sigma factor